jgi:hypothetical protein
MFVHTCASSRRGSTGCHIEHFDKILSEQILTTPSRFQSSIPSGTIAIHLIIQDTSLFGKTIPPRCTSAALCAIGNAYDSARIDVIVRLFVFVPQIAPIDAVVTVLVATVACWKLSCRIAIAVGVLSIRNFACLTQVNRGIIWDFT